MTSFPDLHHLHRLRTDLWKTTGYGQAAVMVGSGFSLNAEPVPGEQKPFPLWRHLAEDMFEKLYPGDPNDNERTRRKVQTVAGLGGMTLASEYEAAFGRQALDQLVLESIPNDRYIPGDLHRLLLELPWADVFTTNYDTLLERTIINERYYQLILTAEDLPGSAHPRIIKLHGGFPSQRPFILTTEDYRTYPRRFAPFVNTVQQALMENTLVLVGFSGDDPNFLHWSGWVRDELRSSAPRMYLCGVLNLTDPQKRVLEQRGVIPIDLTPVIPSTPIPPGKSRHALALHWLILSLKNGQPNSPLRWPGLKQKKVTQPAHLPELLGPVSAEIPEGELFPNPTLPLLGQLPGLLNAWRAARESYPGWLVTPHENRKQIWEHTRHWLYPIIGRSHDLDPQLRILTLFELNWRLERALVPLFLDWVKQIEQALEAVDVERIADTAIPAHLEEAWVNLAFAVIREAREDFDAQRHDAWQRRLLPIARKRPEWIARWHYESCIHALWRLNQREVRNCVEQWRPAPDLLVWQLRRASILAEIGDLAEAERIASDALRRIRTGLLGRRQQIELLSLEGWAMRLLGSVLHGFRLMADDEEWERFRDRWLQLASSRCDPWRETEALELALQSSMPPNIPSDEQKQDFDYVVTYTKHIARDNLTPIVPAFALLRLYEEAGLPMRAGIVNLSSDSVVNACRWIMPFAPLWATATLVRIRQKVPLREAFDRVRIATLTGAEVETLMNWLLPAIRAALEFLPNTPTAHGESFSERVVEDLVDLLSRLCMRMSPQQLEEVFQLALQLYKHPGVRLHVALHDVCEPFFRRLFDAALTEQLCSWLPHLLAIPTLSADDARRTVWESRLWPDPFNELDAERLEGCAKEILSKDQNVIRRIQELLRDAELDHGVERKRAIQRLWILHEARLLIPPQHAAFGKALWAQVNPETGLPDHTDFFAHAFLNLPAPNPATATKAVRDRLLNRPPLRWFNETSRPDGSRSWEIKYYGLTNPIVTHVLAATKPIASRHAGRNLIEWSQEEVRHLLKKAVDWWDADKQGLKVAADTQELRRAAKDLVPFFQVTIMPRLCREAADEWALIERVLAELESSGIPTIGCLPAMLVAWPERANEVATRIRNSLQHGAGEGIAASSEAIRCWAVLRAAHKVPRLPLDLSEEICNRIEFRQEPALKSIIATVAQIVGEAPKILGKRHVEAIGRGLEYLLEETRLLTPDQPSLGNGRLPIGERPLYRARSAWLAFELYKYFQKRSSTPLAVLQRWKEASQNDPLPEVRHVWR